MYYEIFSFRSLYAPLEFDIAPEALSDRSWTDPMPFSMDCSPSISFDKKLGLHLAHIVC